KFPHIFIWFTLLDSDYLTGCFYLASLSIISYNERKYHKACLYLWQTGALGRNELRLIIVRTIKK
ncbi:MAG: hypothetical protein ACXACY_28360, partial [Candidatus Hodarchaeales archaeon]